MVQSTAQRKAKAKYQKAKMKSICLQFHLINDADILQCLEKIANKQGYIKELIRQDIARNSK